MLFISLVQFLIFLGVLIGFNVREFEYCDLGHGNLYDLLS